MNEGASEEGTADLPPDRPVVTYCNMFHPGASRGERARDRLRVADFDARTLLGGFPAWRDATGDVARGEDETADR